MGIPMDGYLHAPTVPSGPTAAGAAFQDASKLSMMELMNEKERIEAELSALSGVLTSHGVDMSTSLTTLDGFPRNDIDVAQIRTTRVRIIRLRNDHKEIMKYLEKGLHAHFAALQQPSTALNTGATTPTSTPETAAPAIPISQTPPASTGIVETLFATVSSVVSGSPADHAGLKAGDTIRNFGGINWVNHERLSKVAEVVQQNEGRTVVVKIVRKNDSGAGTIELDLRLTPRRNWGGRGLLGCHLAPL